jgi:hypothetical protein
MGKWRHGAPNTSFVRMRLAIVFNFMRKSSWGTGYFGTTWVSLHRTSTADYRLVEVSPFALGRVNCLVMRGQSSHTSPVLGIQINTPDIDPEKK